MLKNLSKPMRFMVMASVVVIAYLVLQPILFPADAPKVTKATPPSKPSSKNVSMYLPEDSTAKFSLVSEKTNDVFKPLLVVKSGGSGAAAASQVNVVPLEYAGGEPNWSYTGSARIDGVLEALLENKTTGEDVFLKQGDMWKGISVEEITDDSLILASVETGGSHKLELPPDVVTGPGTGPGGFSPTRLSPLQGAIGQMQLQPDPSTMDPNSPTYDPTGGYGFGNTGGGGRRGGSGRRGGRGGGGRGGGGRGGGGFGG